MPDHFTQQPILAAWQETVRRKPAGAAILSADGSRLRTFGDIETESEKFAATIPDSVAVGAIAVVELGNHAALPAVLLALWRRRLAIALAEAGSCVELPGVRLRITRAFDGGTLVSECQSAPANPEADFLKLTSGTTGAPRAIRFTAAQLLADCDSVCNTMGITDSDLNYGVISWAHSYGFSNLVLPLICRGIPLVLTEDRLPRAILGGLAATRATVLPAVPVFFKKLAELESPPLPALRLCISAGALLPAAVAAKFRARFGIKVHSFYGSSECGGICYDATDGDAAEGFVGLPMNGVRVVENGGRIEVHSPAAGLGYWPSPDETVLGSARFIPSDLVEKNAHGFTLCGRESDFINIAGRKLNPAEIERVLRLHPAVREVVVFGAPSALRGEEAVACIVGEVPASELLAFAAESLASWQMPKHVWPVSAIPVNDRGKLSRRELCERWLQRRYPSL
jgi:acyl-CoA synthetase (AMP-forming)/AMP-acid ligase II